MAPIITVFNFDENVCASTVKMLDPYYTCFVDGKTLLENVSAVYERSNAKFFGFCDKLIMVDPNDIDIVPAFCIHVDTEVTEKDWRMIFKFLQHVFEEIDDMEILKAMTDFFPNDKQDPLPIPPPKEATKPKPYELKCEKIGPIDTVLYEVKRPNGDVYTTVVESFSKNGMLPLFTNLFVCESWGNLAADREFLKILWDREMAEEHGEFSLSKLLKTATEACYPGENRTPIAEPKVYRKSIPAVKKLIHRRMGVYKE